MKKGEKYNPGDPIMSISGGPVMAIIKWDEEKQAYFCKWTEGNNKKFEDYFDEEMLVIPPTHRPRQVGW